MLPDPLDESLAAQFVAAYAFFLELPLHHPLRCDAGVVGAGQPQRRRAGHAPVADERVFQRLLQRVPQVQLAGDVGRRHDDYVGLLAVLAVAWK